MSFKSNKILSRDFYIILAVVVCLLFIKVFTHGVVISLGGDELIKWGLANDFMFFQSHYSFTHHEMRWAHWLQTKLFTSLIDDFWGHYIAALAPITIGLFIISLSIFRIVGLLPSILFLTLTTFDHNLLDLSFRLFPSNGTILPLSILIFFLLNENFRLDNFKNIIIIFFLSIWLYGIKETNIFFVPGIAYLIFMQGGLKYLIKYLILFLLFYVFETIMFIYHASGSMSIFGRFHQLILIGNDYIFDRMANTDSSILNIVDQINKWTKSSNSYIYISLIILLINNFILSKKSYFNSFASLNFSYPIISFMLFSTFMIGQAFNERYWFALIPIFYANIIILLFLFFKKFNFFIRIFVIIFFLIIFNNSAIKNIYDSIYNPTSLFSITSTYKAIQEKILDADCTITYSNISRSYASAYFFYISLMRVHEYRPYQLTKTIGNNDDYKYGWILQQEDSCNETYEFNIQMKKNGMYDLILE